MTVAQTQKRESKAKEQQPSRWRKLGLTLKKVIFPEKKRTKRRRKGKKVRRGRGKKGIRRNPVGNIEDIIYGDDLW